MLSARAFDEAQPAGPRTYMAASRYLTVAQDNHQALLALLRHHAATPWAPWSLLRPVFEASFWAAWLLDPDSGQDRRTRGLQCEIRDAYEQRKHWGAFRKLPAMAAALDRAQKRDESPGGAIAVYKAEAAALHRDFDKLRRGVDVVSEIPRLSFVSQDMAPFLEATWRQLSGFQHGYGWALLQGSKYTVTAHVPGGADLQ